MQKKNRIINFVVLIVACAILIVASLFASKASDIPTQIVETPAPIYTIVVDPGHGFPDPGSIGRVSKVKEADLNLSVSEVLANKLRKLGINVVLTRTDENGLYGLYSANYKKRDMAKRKDIITETKPNMAVSVHMKSYTNTKLRGAQVFYDKSSEISRNLALSIQEFFASELPASDKGVSVGDYFMLKCTDAPSVICECGFLSNPEDEKLLLTNEYQEKVANCIYKGIINFINI